MVLKVQPRRVRLCVRQILWKWNLQAFEIKSVKFALQLMITSNLRGPEVHPIEKLRLQHNVYCIHPHVKTKWLMQSMSNHRPKQTQKYANKYTGLEWIQLILFQAKWNYRRSCMFHRNKSCQIKQQHDHLISKLLKIHFEDL